ncbi:MAG: hypothetical protein D6718_05795 [Acidobacteria bacterium]|nr:MAG: hypothetical protein D6718_05795 [Acidobacteriota bacterium]
MADSPSRGAGPGPGGPLIITKRPASPGRRRGSRRGGAAIESRRKRTVGHLWPIALGVLAATGCGGSAPGAGDRPAAPVRPNVIVFLVDTLRADEVGFGGYARNTTPKLDRWARRGVVFEEATTPAGWTKPAVVSLFTGLYPASHGVQDKEHVVPDTIVTLAEVFRAAGYSTAAFVTNFAVSAKFGCDQGFEKFRWFDKKVDSPPGTPPDLNYVPIGALDDEVGAFLERPPREPFFAYVHTTDPHFPYKPPAEYRRWGEASRDRYDGEVLYTDEYIGRWLDRLERSGVLDRSVVVLTADHGEEFREHGGTGHGITVFAECVRVPLVIWAPGVPAGRRRELVSLADLGPTLLEAAGVPPLPGFGGEGRSFWPLVAGKAGPASGWSWAYSELVYPSKGIAFGYREGNWRVVHIVRDKLGRSDRTYLFDEKADPLEQSDLSGRDRATLERLRGRMRAVRREHLARARSAETAVLDPEDLERLRALGYAD